MNSYTINVPATFAFDISAETEEEAIEAAKGLLRAEDPVSDFGGFSRHYSCPWVAPARADEDYPDLEVVEICPE